MDGGRWPGEHTRQLLLGATQDETTVKQRSGSKLPWSREEVKVGNYQGLEIDATFLVLACR